jgi:predicted ABC-type ATPase
MKQRRPDMVVIAGPNGSGKTTLTRLLLDHEWLAAHTYINADDIAENELGGWNSPEAVRKAARLADERREECLKAGKDFVYETVFSTRVRVAFIERAKAAGYFVRLYFVGTSDPNVNIARVRARVDEGGHDVPADKIVARYHRSMANLKLALPIVDRAYVFDNSRQDEAATRWVRTRDGAIAKVTDGVMPDWVEEAATAPPTDLDRDNGSERR